jgi:hypothetical protein
MSCRGVVVLQDRHDFLGLSGLGHRRESPEVAEDDGKIPPVAGQKLFVA